MTGKLLVKNFHQKNQMKFPTGYCKDSVFTSQYVAFRKGRGSAPDPVLKNYFFYLPSQSLAV